MAEVRFKLTTPWSSFPPAFTVFFEIGAACSHNTLSKVPDSLVQVSFKFYSHQSGQREPQPWSLLARKPPLLCLHWERLPGWLSRCRLLGQNRLSEAQRCCLFWAAKALYLHPRWVVPACWEWVCELAPLRHLFLHHTAGPAWINTECRLFEKVTYDSSGWQRI